MTLTGIWSATRRGKATDGHEAVPSGDDNHRTHFERDYDRLLFSPAVRRMADKTQVFPLEKHASVRNRLTHSHEVSNLARSIGHRLVRRFPELFPEEDVKAAVPSILAAAGLAHDLGNPPFGHRGEEAIRSWFERHKELFKSEHGDLTQDQQSDFLEFEGNAQTLRLLGCLQVSSGGYGLDLTAATLATIMKYTAPAARSGKERANGNAALKKPGFALSEQSLVDWIRAETGLKEGCRHPLTWIMEACDDIAYSVLDVEDAIKKSIVSPEDAIHHLSRECPNPDSLWLTLERDFEKCDAEMAPERAREIKSSYLRTRFIEHFIISVSQTFANNYSAIERFEHRTALLECGSDASKLYSELKSFARRHAYNHPNVLRKELEGANAISWLMDCFWRAISSREKTGELTSRRKGPFASYVYSLISENYRWECEMGTSAAGLPIRYRELRLLADMVAGMTDKYVMELCDSLEPFRDG